MASEKNITFTISLYTSEDWEKNMGGWRCSALNIPGAMIDAIFVNGQKIDDSKYQVLKKYSIIRWSDGTPPPQALASVLLTQELLTQEQSKELSQKWKQTAIILPFVAAVLGSTITYFSNKDKTPTLQNKAIVESVSKNDVIVKDTFNIMFPRGLRAVISSTNLFKDSIARSNPKLYLLNKGIAVGRVDEGTKIAYAALVQKNPEEIKYIPWIMDGKPVSIGYSHAILNAGPIKGAKYKEVQFFQDKNYFKVYIYNFYYS